MHCRLRLSAIVFMSLSSSGCICANVCGFLGATFDFEKMERFEAEGRAAGASKDDDGCVHWAHKKWNQDAEAAMANADDSNYAINGIMGRMDACMAAAEKRPGTCDIPADDEEARKRWFLERYGADLKTSESITVLGNPMRFIDIAPEMLEEYCTDPMN